MQQNVNTFNFFFVGVSFVDLAESIESSQSLDAINPLLIAKVISRLPMEQGTIGEIEKYIISEIPVLELVLFIFVRAIKKT